MPKLYASAEQTRRCCSIERAILCHDELRLQRLNRIVCTLTLHKRRNYSFNLASFLLQFYMHVSTVQKFEVILMIGFAAAEGPKSLCAGFRRTLNRVAQIHNRWFDICSGMARKPVPTAPFWAHLKIGENHFNKHSLKRALFLMATETNRAGLRIFCRRSLALLMRMLLKYDNHHSLLLKHYLPPC